MWTKLTTDNTGWPQIEGLYVNLETVPYLDVRGPAPASRRFYVGCRHVPLVGPAGQQQNGAYLDPGYDTRAEAEAALDDIVNPSVAGRKTRAKPKTDQADQQVGEE